MKVIIPATLVVLCSLLLASCTFRIPLKSNYYQSSHTVGLILDIDPISLYKDGRQGILDVALTPGNKYIEPMKVVDQYLNLSDTLTQIYKDAYSIKGKTLKIIDTPIDYDNIQKYEGPYQNKKYPKYDYRYLKAAHNVDEILVVKVKYGLLVSYYGFVAVGQSGYCRIKSQIIDLQDNSLIFNNKAESKEQLLGEWNTPPAYLYIKQGIQHAIYNSVKKEKPAFD